MTNAALVQKSPVELTEIEQYLTFTLRDEMFAVGIQRVREIIEYSNVTTVPMMPRFVRGVINLRGSVVPVIDLSARFGRTPSAVHRRTCIVVVEVEHDGVEQELGVLVDAVSEVLDISPKEIEAPPSFGSRIRADFISGMGKVEGQFVIMLNVDRVLAVEEMAALAELAGEPSIDG